MDMYESLFSSSEMLNEQIVKELFDIMPLDGPFIIILDGGGNCWASDEDKFSKHFADKQILEQVCMRIGDGAEPVVTQAGDCTVVGTQLTTGKVNCGYLVIVLPGYTTESALANIDLIEMTLNQIALIAKLIEKNNQLHHTELKHLSGVLKNSSTNPN